MSAAQLLIVGLDGLEPSLVRRWIARGDMPNLGRLRAEGRWGELRSTLPYATFPAWTTLMTGVNPGDHGVFDFARLVPGTYDVEFAGAALRRRPSLPRMVSDAGKRVAALGFPATYPPEPINGVMIGGFDSPVAVSIDDSFVHPPELAAELRQRFGRYVFADFAETHAWMPGWHKRALGKLHQGLERRLQTALHLLDREPWDLFMVHFGESDTVAHHFWAFHDVGSPRRPLGEIDAALSDAIGSVYRALDAALGALIERVGPEAHVLVASDHGFGGASDKVLYLNRWLARSGLLRFDARRDPLGAAFGLATKAALGVLPGRVQERMWRMAGPRAGQAEARRRFAGIDWAHTQAFSEELGYHPSIRLNRRGRDPQGVVEDADVEGLTARLIDALEALRDPWSGGRVVRRAWRREDLYRGDAVDQAPELILELAFDNDYSYTLLSSGGEDGPVWRRLSPRERLGAKAAGTNGTHRPDGFWLLHGPDVAPRRARAHMRDLAPTALTALGLAPPAWMEGRALLRASAQPTPIASAPRQDPNTSPYSPAQQAIVEARLRRLGYL